MCILSTERQWSFKKKGIYLNQETKLTVMSNMLVKVFSKMTPEISDLS